jgi:hypothetical protein
MRRSLRRNLDLLIPRPPGRDVTRWATVTQASPLRIKLDGDTDPLDITPDTLVAGLAVDDRVMVARFGRRLVVVGKAGGVDLSGITGDINDLQSDVDDLQNALTGTYTPTITVNTGTVPTLGVAGYLVGKWWLVGRSIHVIVDLLISGTGSDLADGTSWRLSLPTAADTTLHAVGAGGLNDVNDVIGNYVSRSSTLAQSTAGAAILLTSTTMIFYAHGSGVSVGAADFSSSARIKAHVSYLAAT